MKKEESIGQEVARVWYGTKHPASESERALYGQAEKSLAALIDRTIARERERGA